MILSANPREYYAIDAVLDTHHVRERTDAGHLIVDQGRAAFVDSATTCAAPMLAASLGELAAWPPR